MLSEHVEVKALKKLSDKVLSGDRGTVVFVYDNPRLAYEVEFFDEEGDTLELLTVEASEIELIQ